MYPDIPEDWRVLIEPVVEDAGLELVDIMLSQGRQPGLLRITVDTPSGDGRVPVEACARVSREIEANLDAGDAISVPYRLEVSSPGLDRTLAREKDFIAACGSEVRIETRSSLAGRRRFRGRLVSFEDGIALVNIDGGEVSIPFRAVAKANAIYEFTRDDFSGRMGTK